MLIEWGGVLTLFAPDYFMPIFDGGYADLRTPDKILKRATAVLKLLLLKLLILKLIS